MNKEQDFFHELDFSCPTRGKKPQQLFLVLDCETATLPIIKDYTMTDKQRQTISIAKPLIYDIGWQVVSSTGRVYSRHNFLIQETFFVPAVFNTAYYRDKRPLYMDLLNSGKISVANWKEMLTILRRDLEYSDLALAYNAMFDYKKAIPYTNSYIYALYGKHYQNWEDKERKSIENMLAGFKPPSNPKFDGENLIIKNKKYPIADLWGMSCETLINEDKFKKDSIKNLKVSASGLYFKTSAERTTQYIMKNNDFVESHTALDDVLIETDVLLKVIKKKGVDNIPQGIEYFPFQQLGTTVNYCTKVNKKGKPIFELEDLIPILEILYNKIREYDDSCAFFSKLNGYIGKLLDFIFNHWETEVTKNDFLFCLSTFNLLFENKRQINILINKKNKVKEGGEAYKKYDIEINDLLYEIIAMVDNLGKRGYAIDLDNKKIVKAGNENEQSTTNICRIKYC